MTVIEHQVPARRIPADRLPTDRTPATGARRAHPVRVGPRGHRHDRDAARRRPGPSRPPVKPLSYRGAGVVRARGPQRGRPVTPATTVVLALLAALITVWLGIVAQFGAAVSAEAGPVPAELAVVRVQNGETLQQLARRVAPDAPAGRVAAAIRELNDLNSTVLEAGQTLIAPVGGA
ncbi:MAG TPA: LysM peptidoglycan-binding domain-containing protein [Mycobacterium sp.]|nr:LysM peptidoglycan-binding domain-containing protein [Mycobacterium sp.]